MDYHHEQTVVDGIHIAHSFEYPNALGREVATGFVTSDLNKLALQMDNRTMWMLVGINPTRWQLISFPVTSQQQLATLVEGAGNLPAFREVEADGSTIAATASKSNLVIKGVAGVDVGVNAGDEIEIGLASSISDQLTTLASHGNLAGLHLDHHLQYLTTTRHHKVGLHALTSVVGGITVGCVPHDRLGGLTDVEINNNTLAQNQVLAFTGGFWQNIAYPVATSLRNGLMSASDKIKLDGMSASDARLKTQIEKVADTTDALSIINKIDAVFFRWNADNERVAGFGDQREIGFLAQQLEPLLPELVRTDDDGYKMIRYAQVCGLLLEGIKELHKQVQIQQCQLAYLRGLVER